MTDTAYFKNNYTPSTTGGNRKNRYYIVGSSRHRGAVFKRCVLAPSSKYSPQDEGHNKNIKYVALPSGMARQRV